MNPNIFPTNTNLYKKYLFHYLGQQSTYLIDVSISNDDIKFSCSCNERQSCKHIHNIVLGRTVKVKHDEAALVKELASILLNHSVGIKYIEAARYFFQNDDACRRCNSKNIIDTKSKTVAAKFFKLFSKHRYYCKDCHWSW